MTRHVTTAPVKEHKVEWSMMKKFDAVNLTGRILTCCKNSWISFAMSGWSEGSSSKFWSSTAVRSASTATALHVDVIMQVLKIPKLAQISENLRALRCLPSLLLSFWELTAKVIPKNKHVVTLMKVIVIDRNICRPYLVFTDEMSLTHHCLWSCCCPFSCWVVSCCTHCVILFIWGPTFELTFLHVVTCARFAEVHSTRLCSASSSLRWREWIKSRIKNKESTFQH
jgi:hypothetical protein